MFSNLCFSIAAGQLIQIEGANGAGKTSLIRILSGLSRYGFQGSVQRNVPLLYLGHQPGVKGMLTARENLAWHVAGESNYDEEAIESALARVGLYGYEDVPSHTLSAGQHRRVNLARLYLSSCPLWLLDEPFTAIDTTGVSELETLLASHARKGGSVLLTSHQALAVDWPVKKLNLNQGLLL